MRYKVHFGPEEVLTFLQLHPFLKHKVKHTYLISTDSKHKDKNSILVFVEYISENFLHIDDSNTDVQEVIWTDRLSSKFKNKYTVKILWRLTEKYNKKFSWKFFATLRGKGIVDGVSGNCKSIVQQKTFSKGKDCIIVQNAKEFADAISRFVASTKVAYINQSINHWWEN